MMYLYDFLGPWPPQQEILLYKVDPRIPFYEGTIGKLRYPYLKGLVVVLVEYSMNQIMIKVKDMVQYGGAK